MDENENSSITMNELENVLPIVSDNPPDTSQQKPPTDIPQSSSSSSAAGPSSSGAGPSEIKPYKEVDGFHIDVVPARVLKQAIDAATDPFFNRSGLGRVDSHEKLVGITIMSRDELFGCLVLSEYTGMYYHCNRTVVAKLVDLTQIRDGLRFARAEDLVSVVYVHGSNEITFTFGKESKDLTRIFAVPFLKRVADFPEFPHGTRLCHIVVMSDEFKKLIEEELVKDRKPQLVTVTLRTKSSTVAIGQQRITNNFPSMGDSGMADEKVVQALFDWPYPQVLEKATRLSSVSMLCFTREPPEHILMHFGLHGLLIFIREAHQMILHIPDPYA